MLALFDLNGFKYYNDSFGHLAGDTLLRGSARTSPGFAAGRGSAYRIGGDEFCLLLDQRHDAAELTVSAAARALEEHGDGFASPPPSAPSSCRAKPPTATDALRLADQRMYAQKNSGRRAGGHDRRTAEATAG